MLEASLGVLAVYRDLLKLLKTSNNPLQGGRS